MWVRGLLLGGLVLVAGCATPSQRISTKLIGYGVPEPQAVCMGDRLQQRLSYAQLKRIGEIGKSSRDEMGRMSVPQVAAALNRPGDEALVAEVLRAGVGCLL
jgi:hypothetical protein